MWLTNPGWYLIGGMLMAENKTAKAGLATKITKNTKKYGEGLAFRAGHGFGVRLDPNRIISQKTLRASGVQPSAACSTNATPPAAFFVIFVIYVANQSGLVFDRRP